MIRWLIFFFAISSTAYCQHLIEATIIDAETKTPVSFASIGIVGSSKGTSSDLNGQFSLSVADSDSLKISCIGYQSLIIYSTITSDLIELQPIITQLSEIVILDKPINARRVLRKALARIKENYTNQPFMQKFFYRHYCKDDSAYGRLIEASVDVWKNQGYRSLQKAAGDKEEIRITQLRRSLDKTTMAKGHEPISIGNILQADIVGYQTTDRHKHLSFYTDVSNLITDFDKYSFTCKAITYFDGLEVYEINYTYRKDSVLTTSGKYLALTQVTGSLFVTTDTYAFVKSEEIKSYAGNTLRSLAYYRKYAGRYYPYHFVRDSESHQSHNRTHSVHLELMSVEIKTSAADKFIGHLPNPEELLNIPYDSAFWTSNTILKTTPLEDSIIRDLGGGISLNKQFHLYHEYEMHVREGGKNGEEKFNWFKDNSKGTRILYLLFWSTNFQPYLIDIELAKRLQKKYRNKVTFIFLSLEDDENVWLQTVQQFSLYTDGIINYRIGSRSKTAASLSIAEIPGFMLLTRDGEMIRPTKRPSDPSLEEDLLKLIRQH